MPSSPAEIWPECKREHDRPISAGGSVLEERVFAGTPNEMLPTNGVLESWSVGVMEPNTPALQYSITPTVVSFGGD
jgi:hypothetical protein